MKAKCQSPSSRESFDKTTVYPYMTIFPHTIGKDQKIAVAQAMMEEHGVRHLPVLEKGKLIGIVTDRDIKMVKTFRDVDPRNALIEEALIEDPLTVSPHTPLSEVCEKMAKNKFGCALVVENGRCLGLFSYIDALRALAKFLKDQ